MAKPQKTAKEQGNEILFVEVRDPSEVRRDILESLKQILELLHRFESFKHLRHEKSMKIQKLRTLVRDTNKRMSELRTKLPQTNFKVASHSRSAPPKKYPAKRKDKQQKLQKKEKTELERLQDELGAIESKLKSFT